jgi:hypothetical protein
MNHAQSKSRDSKTAATIRIVGLLVVIALLGQAAPQAVYGSASAFENVGTPQKVAAPQGEIKPRFSISWTVTATGHYEHTGSFGSTQVIDEQARMAGSAIWREEDGLASQGYNDPFNMTFSVANKPPRTAITSPATGARFNTNVIVILEGLGLDLEDGSLDDSALHWSSDIAGTLGTGRLNEVVLSHSTHTITLTVQGSAGLSATDNITVAVLPPGAWMPSRVYLPIVKR